MTQTKDRAGSRNTQERLAFMGLDTLYVQIPIELKKLIGDAADKAGLSLNEYIAAIFGREYKRPDLAAIPRKRPGRPRKMKLNLDVTNDKAALWSEYFLSFSNSEFSDLLDPKTLDDYLSQTYFNTK